MDRLIYTAMTGASQTMGRQAAVAHNLANVTSTGYRAEEHRLRAVQVQAHNTPAALPTRAFAVDASTHTDFTAGSDAIHRPRRSTSPCRARAGSRWPCPTAARPTRATAASKLSVNGVLQTRTGIPVQGDGGPITIPPDSKISIGNDGTVSVVPETGAQNTVNVDRPHQAGQSGRGRSGARRRWPVPADERRSGAAR